jgi:hypothetical protein
MKKTSTLFVILVSCTLQFTAKAQLIFRESFSYNVGDLLQGQTGGTGFPAGSTWSNTGTLQGGSAASLNSATIVSGSINGTGTAGNRVRVCTQGAGNRSFFDRAIDLTANVDGPVGNRNTYWLGFWYSLGSGGPLVATGTPNQSAIPAQIVLLSVPNTVPTAIGSNQVYDMRIGAGKSSNIGSSISLSGFTGANGEACNAGAASFPSQNANSATAPGTWGANALGLPTGNDTKYILIKISKAEFTKTSGGFAQFFDGVRIWFLDAQPTSSSNPIFTTRPNGDILTSAISSTSMGGNSATTGNVPNAINYSGDEPIATRGLRPSVVGGTAAPDGSTQACGVVTGGVTGLRIRVEGAVGFCFDFDEIAFGTTVESLVLAPAPVTYDAFAAKPSGDVNILEWITSAEVDNKGFHVERSSDGTNWEKIGFENAKGTAVGNYTFIDKQPYEITYYRLQQEDIGGHISLSKIVKVVNGKKASIKIYPTVAKNIVTLQVPSSLVNKQAIVYNSVGAIIGTYTINNLRKDIDVSSMPSGLYTVKIIDNTSNISARFIKQ